MIKIENRQGGTINSTTADTTDKPKRRKGWLKKWRAFGLTFAIANCRIKKRDMRRDHVFMDRGYQRKMMKIRETLHNRNQGCCPICGKHVDKAKGELHHVLPWCSFPELRGQADNLALLCHRCHKEVHKNPYLNIKLQEAKARELGINLKDHYDYADENDRPQE